MFADTETPVINILHGWSGNCGQFFLCFLLQLYQTNMYCFIILLHSFSCFLHTKSLLASYAYVSIESILWLLAFNTILLTSSVNTSFSLINLDLLNIKLLFSWILYDSLWDNMFHIYIFLNGLSYFQVYFLLNSLKFSNPSFLFMIYFCVFCFFVFTFVIC